MSDRPDLSAWLTKREAAEAIGVGEKTVQELAAAGKLQRGSWRRDGRGPILAVYHPDDVAREAAARRPGAAAFVLPAAGPGLGNGAGRALEADAPAAADLVRQPAAGDDVLRAVFAAALRAVTSETSRKSEKLFLTLEEASAFTGLSPGALRRLVREEKLEAVRDRRLKFRRRDLEAL